jgi:tetratricopeptide (TPR) repeat protein
MSELLNQRGRFFIAAGLYTCLLLGCGPRLQAQELPLKRDLPGTDSIVCPEVAPGQEPSDEEREESIRLGSFADQETILGDYERARDLLARAVELDPTSAELAYRYGRVMESLEETELAIEQFCRALRLGSREQGIGDARPRLEALARAREPLLPEAAKSEFLNGLLHADLGDFQSAVESFRTASELAPEWADPIYNRGVIRIRMGEAGQAVEDLQEYLRLQPDAEDAILVSQRIGQLQIVPSRGVSAGTAFGLGLVLPGGGQFYSGRALGGLGVLALAGGAAAAGFLIEEVDVRCVGSAPSGDCPPERIISETSNKPYKTYGLAAAGAVAFLGALEAFLKARGSDGVENEELMGVEIGAARILLPEVSTFGSQVQINLVRVTF